MPLYDYTCQHCHHVWEHEGRITDPPLEQCPECGGPAKRLISGPAQFQLKGHGWYRDGYVRKNDRTED